jgi:hypothetical protein
MGRNGDYSETEKWVRKDSQTKEMKNLINRVDEFYHFSLFSS